jgi:hypothetical protein
MALVTPNRQVFQRPTSTTRLPGGWQTGDPTAIARRYSGNTGALQSNLGNISRFAPSRPAIPSAPTTGAAGVTGPAGPAAPAITELPEVVVSAPAEGVQPPQGNATQRWSESKEAWKANGGTSRTFNQANVARGVRPPIDGRAAPDPKASTASEEIRRGWENKRAEAATERSKIY